MNPYGWTFVPDKKKSILMVILNYILTTAFVLAGAAKIFKAKPMVDQFKEFGLPVSMTILIGILEVLGAAGLHFPSLSLYAAIGLLLLMFGAIANHLKVKHPISKVAPSGILLILLLISLYFKIK